MIGQVGGLSTLLQVAVRAPLIIRVPGLTDSGVRSSELVEFVDIFPTLAEAAGFPVPEICPQDSQEVGGGDGRKTETSE